MNKPVIDQSVLFPACVQVLDRLLCPVRYSDLAVEALASMGYSTTDVSFDRVKEDIREKLPMRQSLAVFYTGAPDCLMARARWFKTAQQALLQVDTVTISGNAHAGYLGAFELAMRAEHFVQKHANASPISLNRGRARGLVIEHHVTEWFRENYSEFYLPPDNAGKWHIACSHDFKLQLAGREFLIDVAGPDRDGLFGNVKGGKRKTDFHLLCQPYGHDVQWVGVTTGTNYKQGVVPESSLSPTRLLVWLNCKRAGIDYDRLAGIAYTQIPA